MVNKMYTQENTLKLDCMKKWKVCQFKYLSPKAEFFYLFILIFYLLGCIGS